MRVPFARPRQRSKEAFTSSRNSHSVCKHYYELVGIPIRYAATHYFRRCISVSLLRFRSREIIVCLIILICYSATLCAWSYCFTSASDGTKSKKPLRVQRYYFFLNYANIQVFFMFISLFVYINSLHFLCLLSMIFYQFGSSSIIARCGHFISKSYIIILELFLQHKR